ncbi:murein biosynthesis integral membrane protein MurJ [Candidatus Poriferisocius sp.]|uniref:murein biosynthesis integral membrane protein MurJ n=1 Tax=Candidatus Poriferisocius sp. TaxID=3101276 RepID=UPI003B5CD1CE
MGAYPIAGAAPIAYFAIPPVDQHPDGSADAPRPSGRAAVLVGAGIFFSRVAGIGREVAVAAFIGAGRTGDAYRAALTIPRLLQNLLGEGALSASFIPLYSQLVEQGRRHDAGRLAGAVFGLLAVVTGLVVLAGWLLAEPLVSLLLWRLSEPTAELTVELVRVMFAGIGFIVLAAWALGVLNAHRRFFLSYAAPVIWNLAQIGFMVGAWLAWQHVFPPERASDVARMAALGVVVGGALQFLVQVPLVLRLVPSLRLSLNWRRPDVRLVAGRFAPALAGRGVVQLSAYVDLVLAGMLATGAIAALGFAQVIYFLPISLFAMSVAASELPEMARDQHNRDALVQRLQTGLDRIGFYVLFCAVAFITLGGLIVGALLERGQFAADQTVQVWFILAAYSLGLVATSSSRLLQNACFAAGDAKGPARVATVRVLLAAGVGASLMFVFDSYTVIGGRVERFEEVRTAVLRAGAENDVRLGAVGLALGSTVAAWAEYGILRRRVGVLLRQARPVRGPVGRLAVAGVAAGVLGGVLAWGLDPLPLLVAAPFALLVTGMVYVVLGRGTGVAAAEEAAAMMEQALARIKGRLSRGRSPGDGRSS